MAEESHFVGADSRRPWTLPTSLSHLFADRFQLLGRIQRGPQGTLYLGIDHELDEEVVVKVFDRDPLDLSLAEPPLASALLQEHALVGTPRVVEVGAVDGHAFVATRMVRGESLAARLTPEPMPIPRALELVQSICAVLAQAHALGIVHGDLKPRNVLFGEDDGAPVVLDFGRAVPTALIPSLSVEEGREVVLYLSPEQLEGDPPTPASDVYALGVLLYRLLSGNDPFPGENSAELLRARAVQGPTPIEQAMGGVELPAMLQWLVTRCLATSPAERFPDAVKLQRLLETWATTTSPPDDGRAIDAELSTPVNGPTLTPGVEQGAAQVAPPMELQHVRAWHVDLDAAAVVHEALTAAENEPTQPGFLMSTVDEVAAAPPQAAPVSFERPPEPSRGVPVYAWGLAAAAAIGATLMLLLR
ncbi:serine/threonine protein kinase [Myxococcota bacterium]|nr:serine/threonine protein kinase [Myxococcota bacterium]